MTLAQVAQKANVAIATASKVFNNDKSVRSYLRERVLEAAAELNYQPSMMARALRKKQTNIVTLGIMQLENPYFGALAQAVGIIVAHVQTQRRVRLAISTIG